MTIEHKPSAIAAQLSPVMKRALLWVAANEATQQSEPNDVRLSDLMGLWAQNLGAFRVNGWRPTPLGRAVSAAVTEVSGDE